MIDKNILKTLDDAYPDLYYPKEEAKYLLGVLFLRKPSCVAAFA